MELDINKIHHNYITKVVILTLFLYRRKILKNDEYKACVNKYLTSRLNLDVKLDIEFNQVELAEKRSLLIDSVLNNIDNDLLSTINVSFQTPIKRVRYTINLNDFNKYQDFIYN